MIKKNKERRGEDWAQKEEAADSELGLSARQPGSSHEVKMNKIRAISQISCQ